MRALIQRVTRAEVAVAGEVIGQIGPSLIVIAGPVFAGCLSPMA